MSTNSQLQTSTAPRAAAQAAQNFVVPPVDIYEDEHAITLLADLPGVAKEDLAVRVEADSLSIEATATAKAGKDLEIVYEEVNCPAFRRQFTLSRELDGSRIEAQLRDGVLRLTIPKAEEAKPRRIQVQVG